MRAAVVALMAALALAGCGRKGALVRQGAPPPASAAEPIKPTVVDPERREDWRLEENEAGEGA